MDLFARDRTFWRLVGFAAIVGTGAGAAAWAFTRFVARGTLWLWGEDIDYDFFGGEWWWLLITTGAGVLVGLLRWWLQVPEDPTGALAAIQEARVDHTTAIQTIGVSAVSLIGGASLGPFDAGVRSGGGIGSWLSARLKLSDEEREVTTLSGINGAIGGLLTAPVLATLLITELRQPDPSRFYKVVIPNLVGSIFGFFVIFSISGDTFLGVFGAEPYDVKPWHFAIAVVLGLVAAALSWLLGMTVVAVRKIALRAVSNSVVRAGVGGLGFGLIGIVLPLTLASGKEQLSVGIDRIDEFGAALMVAVVLGKTLAIAISIGTGFIGGPVMPTLFLGGAAGLAIHLIIPDLPLAFTLSCMLVAVPGTTIKAPFSMALLAVVTVGVGPADAAPAAVAVVTAYLATSGLGLFGVPAGRAVDPDEDHQTAFRDELFEITEAEAPR